MMLPSNFHLIMNGPPPPKREPHWRDSPGGGHYRGMQRLRIFDTAAPLGKKCVADLQGPSMARLEASGAEIGYPESTRFVYLRRHQRLRAL